MKKIISILVIAAMAFALSGCATVFKGGTQEVPVNSSPSGAEVIINGVSQGVTPLNLQLESNKSYTVVVRNGTEERTFVLRSEIGTLWLVLDVVTGLVPLIVDAATGNWYELEPGEVFVSF